MNGAAAIPRRSQIIAGCALGLYAAAIALARSRGMTLALAAPLALVPLAWWTLLGAERWIALFLAAAALLPPLPIALGDSGPHPAILFAALGLAAGWLRLNNWRVPANLLTVSLAAYFLVLLGSSAIAAMISGPAIAAGTVARVLLFGIAVYLFFYAAYGPGPAIGLRLVFWVSALSALFACLDFYYQFPAPAGFGPQFVWLETGVFRRAQGFFYEASTLGNFCAFWLVGIAAALRRRPRDFPISRAALVVSGAIFAAALVLSYSRASLVNLAAALAALLWLGGGVGPRFALKLAGVFAAGLALLAWIFPHFAGIYWVRLRASAEFFFSATGSVLSGRLESWSAIGGFLAEHPWALLVGVGYKTLPYSEAFGRPVIADNMYLAMLAETGIIGLAAMLLFSFAILRAARASARSADETASFFGTWIFCFWIGQMIQMLSGDLLTYWRVLPFYFWALAMAVRRAG